MEYVPSDPDNGFRFYLKQKEVRDSRQSTSQSFRESDLTSGSQRNLGETGQKMSRPHTSDHSGLETSRKCNGNSHENHLAQ